MNAKTRYKGKIPALLIVPASGTKRGWIARLQKKFKHTSSYMFRVVTANSNLERQIFKLPSRFRTVVFVNNPLSEYSGVLRRMSEKGIHGFGIHLFRSQRRRVALNQSELKRWNEIIRNQLNEIVRPKS